jgi:hypothetical protein
MQLDPDGLVTIMDDKGHILASWLGTSSYWALAGPLTAVGLRCKSLGKVGRGGCCFVSHCPMERKRL